MKKFTKAQGLVAVAVGALLLAGGLATASNMGFKFVPSVGANQFFDLSLPWNNNYTNAASLLTDITGATRVSRYNPTGTVTDWFSGAAPANNFTIVKGDAYIVRAGGSGISSAVVVGSHDPAFTFSFTANQFRSASAPYHQTLTKASQLLSDMQTQMGANSVSRVSRYNATGTLTDWFSGAAPANNFNLTLGMGVIVRGGSAGGSGYVWPHY
jgi:hypothetical protein